jgi:hypothetical protein
VVQGDQVSIINGPGLAHTGDTLLSLGTGGVRRQFAISPGRSYTLRFATKRAQVMDFFSTGVDDLRNPLAPGLVDQHYYLVPGLLPSYVLFTNEPPFLPPTSWTPNRNSPVPSQWIAPYARVPATNLMGDFIFRTYVNLYEQDPNTFSARRQFRWSGDDVGDTIRVNGRIMSMPGAVSSNFYGSGTTLELPQLNLGLNLIEFFVNDTNGAEGLRVEVNPGLPLVKSNAQFFVTIGGATRTIVAQPNWGETEIVFVPSGNTETLTFESSTGEVWLDTVSVEASSSLFLHPEEPFEILEGERAMGEWRLEVRDTRTGAILPTSEVLQWSLELDFADTFNPALQMEPGDIAGPLTIRSNQVKWVVIDPCQGATFARLTLRGLGNVDELLLFADHNGFPTGHPELDDFLPIPNLGPGPNGTATFEISTLLPAPARLTGKPIFIGIINQFLDRTNRFELEFESDGNCAISGPPSTLLPDNPAVGSLDPVPNGGSSTNENDGLFQFSVPPNARAATVTVVSDGDVTVYGQKDAAPTTTTFSYRANGTFGPGTETMRIDQSSTPPLTSGTYFVRIVNNTAQQVNFTVTLTFEFDSGPGDLFVNMIRTSTGELQLQFFEAEVGSVYIIEATDDLRTLNWATIDTVTAAATFETYPITVELTRQYRFFRVREQ